LDEPIERAKIVSWRRGVRRLDERALPAEIAVALTYERVTFAVMMASPVTLEDFAIGFSISEGIIEQVSEITALEVVAVEGGIECRMALAPARREALEARRRRMAGPVGCGLCGIDSLAQAIRPAVKVAPGPQISAQAIADGMAAMARGQVLNHATRAVHGAAFLRPDGGVLVREDVGRHNALDKVIGAASAAGEGAAQGAVLLTSRVSIELIQKTARFGAPILAAISVPTARAVREARDAGITLIAVARDDGFEIFTHPDRVDLGEATSRKTSG
jgi:FdhD protein